jgi:hypothetical protein
MAELVLMSLLNSQVASLTFDEAPLHGWAGADVFTELTSNYTSLTFD